MQPKVINIPEYCADRKQARELLENVRNVHTLRLDYRNTYFAGRGFSHELAVLIDNINPVVIEIKNGHERFRNLFISYLDRPVTLVKSR